MSSHPFSAACLLAAALAAGCAGSAQPGGGPAAPPPTPVQTITLTPQPLAHSSEYVAMVRSLRSTTIQPQVDGIVREILVKAGDHVRAGQPLVQIDPDEQQATVHATESQRAALAASLALARQQLTRVRQLEAAGAISRADVDQAETAVATADAQLNAITSQIREQQVQLDYYRVTAPTEGILGDIPVRVGDRVTTATPITTIDAKEGMEVYLNVPVEEAVSARLGLPVELVDASGAVVATNPVTFIAPRADDGTQSVLVKARLRELPPTLRVLQYVRARIIWREAPALTVPIMAVTRLGGQYFVYVAESGPQGVVARQKPVQLGAIAGNDYPITSGLAAGEKVIISNIQKIGNGAPVRPEA